MVEVMNYSSNEMEEDRSEVYDNNLEYFTDVTVPNPTEENLQSLENIPAFEIFRGDEVETIFFQRYQHIQLNLLHVVEECVGIQTPIGSSEPQKT